MVKYWYELLYPAVKAAVCQPDQYYCQLYPDTHPLLLPVSRVLLVDHDPVRMQEAADRWMIYYENAAAENHHLRDALQPLQQASVYSHAEYHGQCHTVLLDRSLCPIAEHLLTQTNTSAAETLQQTMVSSIQTLQLIAHLLATDGHLVLYGPAACSSLNQQLATAAGFVLTDLTQSGYKRGGILCRWPQIDSPWLMRTRWGKAQKHALNKFLWKCVADDVYVEINAAAKHEATKNHNQNTTIQWLLHHTHDIDKQYSWL